MRNDSDNQLRDKLLWVVVALLLGAGFWMNYQYAQVAGALRLAGWIVLSAIIVAIAAQTVRGQSIWQYAKEARGELRKVAWPNRQETTQTTMIVVLAVVVMAMILWAIDAILLLAISRLMAGG